MSPLLPLVVAVAISMLAITLMARVAPRLGLIDRPGPRKVHLQPVPRVGGWGIVLGTLVAVATVLPVSPLLLAYGAGALVLFAFGVWDDLGETGHWTKFTGQFLAVGLVVGWGGLYVERLPFLGLTEIPPALGIPLTVFAWVGAINATNHSDGLDGLAGGETLLSLLAVGFLAYLAEDGTTLALTAAAAGGILGFLRFNTYPARVFMGDSGSQFLGFTLAFLVLYLTQRSNTALSAALPLLLFGLPVLDILVVLFLRIRAGAHWFRATRNHIHHRLLDRGFHHYEAVVLIYSVQALLVFGAVFLRFESDWLVTAVYLAGGGALLGVLSWMERRGWRAHAGGSPSPLAALVERVAGRRSLYDAPMKLIALALPAYLVVGSLAVEAVPRDFGLVSAVVATLLLAELAVARPVRPLTRRFAVYVAASFVVYLLAGRPVAVPLLANPVFTLAFHTLLALGIAVTVRFSTTAAFATTPMDYLVAFGLLAVGVFAGQLLEAGDTAALLVKAAIVLYGCELLLVGRRKGLLLSTASLMVLGVLAWKGLA